MIRNVESRLLKLEAVQTPLAFSPRHMVGGTNDECEAQRQAMIASGDANEADGFIFLIPAQFPLGGSLVGGK
jgi:hypothetical protein